MALSGHRKWELRSPQQIAVSPPHPQTFPESLKDPFVSQALPARLVASIIPPSRKPPPPYVPEECGCHSGQLWRTAGRMAFSKWEELFFPSILSMHIIPEREREG